jgi:hypothetical protein
MTFKLRSGNSPKFKHIGSSPLKNVDDDGLGNHASQIMENTRRTKQQMFDENQAYEKKKRQAETELIENAPWNEKSKAETATLKGQKGPKKDETTKKTSGKDAMTKTDVGEGGYKYGGDGSLDDPSRFDANINKYKTKSQIKEDAKQRKLKSKLYDSDDGSKLTHAEKYANEQQELADKYQRARGEGTKGLKFDWKNMLLGNSIASGFSIERKQDLIADKMSKMSKKRRDYIDKQEGKKSRSNIKIESYNNEIGEIDAYSKDLTSQRDKIKDVESQEYKDLTKKINKATKQKEKLNKKVKKTTSKRNKVKNKYKTKGREKIDGTREGEGKGNTGKDYSGRKYKKEKKEENQ